MRFVRRLGRAPSRVHSACVMAYSHTDRLRSYYWALLYFKRTPFPFRVFDTSNFSLPDKFVPIIVTKRDLALNCDHVVTYAYTQRMIRINARFSYQFEVLYQEVLALDT